jgi:hypothetical protein
MLAAPAYGVSSMTFPLISPRAIGLLVLAGFGPLAQAAVPAAPSQREQAQREVLASVDALFDAMAAHDVAAARKLLVPGTSFVVLRPDGRVLMERDSEFLKTLGTQKGDWRERIWSPQVLVQGNLAQVWAPYDFHLDGKLSHCGIDSFAMTRDASGWRIAGISYSVQTHGCAPSPLDAATR